MQVQVNGATFTGVLYCPPSSAHSPTPITAATVAPPPGLPDRQGAGEAAPLVGGHSGRSVRATGHAPSAMGREGGRLDTRVGSKGGAGGGGANDSGGRSCVGVREGVEAQSKGGPCSAAHSMGSRSSTGSGSDGQRG